MQNSQSFKIHRASFYRWIPDAQFPVRYAGRSIGYHRGIDTDWTDSALNTITDELTNDPLESGQKLVLVGFSAGGTIAIELLDDLQGEGIYVDLWF